MSPWTLDLSQVATHLLIHWLEKSHKLVDPYLFLKNDIAEYFVGSILSHLVKNMYSQNLWRQHSISLLNRAATQQTAQQIKKASQVWMYSKFSSTCQRLAFFFVYFIQCLLVSCFFFLSSKNRKTGFMCFCSQL